MNKVYIILVNYNNFIDTIECLESILKSSYLNFQIFVIDNSPNDVSINKLLGWIAGSDDININTNFNDLVFPLEQKPIDHIIVNENEFRTSGKLYENKITIIRAKNNGFAAANNIALRYILDNGGDSSLIWILNNDTVIEKDTLYNLTAFYNNNANKNVIIGSKLKYYFKPDTLQAVAGKYNTWLGKHAHVGDGEKDNGQYDNYKFTNCDYLVGASIFLPVLFIKETGLMCEDYFLYFEELDWIKSGSRHGFDMALAPNATVYHKEGSSIINTTAEEKNTSTAAYYSIVNRVRFIKKWYPYRLVTVMPGVFIALIKRLFKGKVSLVKKASITICFFLLS
ncbi:MAG: hypothetical protein JWP44_2807 [Mucilaginibacter sp.]|nr:hypothetical protein [Mucilaginibacter sp.]